MNTIRVLYTIKDQRGFLIEVERSFINDTSAIQFIRTLNNLSSLGFKVIGKPVIETVRNG